ncbi:hypothetical protein BSKO_05857 [Bryopsis sp. KO-2023]|nr:hypothetical protein BSKO_05857 [Bryopsis sp. KO-2023]
MLAAAERGLILAGGLHHVPFRSNGGGCPDADRLVLPRRRDVGVCARRGQELQVGVPVQTAEPVEAPRSTAAVGFGAGVVAFVAVSWAYLKRKELDQKIAEQEKLDSDPEAYLLARARTRQAIHVQKAIGFNNSNIPPRAMVELERALKENAVCRSTILQGNLSPDELEGLYSLHIQNEEIPPDFATLLQLRNMLGISESTAERIEKGIQESNVFTI